MNSNRIFSREVSYWTSKSPLYANFFKNTFTIKILELCEIINNRKPFKEKMIVDFISGLALFPIYLHTMDEELGKKFDRLTQPVIDIINSHVMSEEYRNELLQDHLDKGLLMSLLKKINITVLIPSEVSMIESEFNEWVESKSHRMKNKISQPTGIKSKKLSVKQIALIHVYRGVQLKRENASAIAASFGFNNKSSGEGLYQDFNFFSSRANRIGETIPPTLKKMRNKIGLFEGILDHLDIKEKEKALDEIRMLKARLREDYL